MPVSEQKSLPLYVNDKNPVKEQIPASEHKRPSLTENDTNIPDNVLMTYNNHKMWKRPF